MDQTYILITKLATKIWILICFTRQCDNHKLEGHHYSLSKAFIDRENERWKESSYFSFLLKKYECVNNP